MSQGSVVGARYSAPSDGAMSPGAAPAVTYPALYEAADASSLAGQQVFKWMVVADLGLLGAALAVSLANQIVPAPGADWSQVIAAALLAFAFIARYIGRHRGYDAR